MTDLFTRYRQGFYQEVYEELVALQDKVFEPDLYDDALAVAREIMRRVRFNLEQILIPGLMRRGYRFGDGAFDYPGSAPDATLLEIQRAYPIFQPPTQASLQQINTLEQMVGPLPLTLKCWYEEVGAVNLIGSFHTISEPARSKKTYKPLYKPGYGLDPLFIYPLEIVIAEQEEFAMAEQEGLLDEADESGTYLLALAPDSDFKYGYSGGGAYEIAVPCQTFDGFLLGEEHELLFVNYLRLSLRWGGIPGLEKKQDLSPQELQGLTRDLLPF